MKIKTGDKVKVLSGKDRGKTGKVLQVFPDKQRASVEGVNLMHKHMRSQQRGQSGQRIEFPSPLRTSNLSLICPQCNKPARVGYKVLDNKNKVRVCKKCNETIN